MITAAQFTNKPSSLNYVCTDTSGNSSTTKTDWLGNDNTTFSNGDTMSCKTDWLGNYVCN